VDEYEEEEIKTGIYIDSTPSSASVYINGFLEGTTPLHIETLDAGQYTLEILAEGYRTEERWIDYDGSTYTEYWIQLQELTGYIRVAYEPADALVFIDGENADMGTNVVRIGNHVVRIKAFSYEPAVVKVFVEEDQTTTVEGILEEATLRIENIGVSRRTFSPKNPGKLGKVTVGFEVTTYGTGVVNILDEQDTTVFSYSFPEFTTWEQSMEWNGRTKSGSMVPDGKYRAVISAQSSDGAVQVGEETYFWVDRSHIISYRSTWTGMSGMLYTPTTDVLPELSVQVGASFMGHYSTTGTTTRILFPLQASLRVTPIENLELTVQGSIIPQGTATTPYSVGVSAKYRLLNKGIVGFAPLVKATYASGTTADIQTNFFGASLAAPFQLSLGPVLVVLAPELAFSPERVDYSLTETYPSSLYVWPYARAGVLLQVSAFTVGISGAMRFTPFTEAFTVHWPVAAGIEASWVLPNTQFALVVQGAGEFSIQSGMYLMAGVGFGLLN
jgi:hypothetical protein